MIKTFFAVTTVLASLPVVAQINIATPATFYTQNFNALTTSTTPVTWTNDVTLAGWSLFDAAGTALPTYLAGTGSSSSGSYYSFGSTGSSDRALGSLASGNTYFNSPASGAVAGYSAVAFKNNTGTALNSFTLSYDGEQWRYGNTTAQSLELSYGFGATFTTVSSWATPGGIFNFTSPIATSSTAAVDGNGVGLVAGLGGTVTTPWAAGSTLWVRWADRNDTGADHGLAIDNLSFSVTAIPEPGTYTLLLAGLGVVGFVARRRRG